MTGVRTAHAKLVGHTQPKCPICGLDAMQIQRMPYAQCRPIQATLFEAIELKAVKADVRLKPDAKRATE